MWVQLHISLESKSVRCCSGQWGWRTFSTNVLIVYPPLYFLWKALSFLMHWNTFIKLTVRASSAKDRGARGVLMLTTRQSVLVSSCSVVRPGTMNTRCCIPFFRGFTFDYNLPLSALYLVSYPLEWNSRWWNSSVHTTRWCQAITNATIQCPLPTTLFYTIR